jgi:hypothetical protein
MYELINGTWIIDENRNKVNVAEYGIDKATKMLASLENCFDCENCENCEDCKSCVNCKNLLRCNYCENCSFSKDCEQCKNCSFCDNCKNCEQCKNCSYCTECTRTKNLFDKHYKLGSEEEEKDTYEVLSLKDMFEMNIGKKLVHFVIKRKADNDYEIIKICYSKEEAEIELESLLLN